MMIDNFYFLVLLLILKDAILSYIASTSVNILDDNFELINEKRRSRCYLFRLISFYQMEFRK